MMRRPCLAPASVHEARDDECPARAARRIVPAAEHAERSAAPILQVKSPRDLAPRIVALARRANADSLLRNSLYIMATTVVTSLLGYVYWIVAARTYPARDVGLGSALLAAITLASGLTNLGLGQTLVQLLPQRAAGAMWSRTVNAAFGVAGTTGLFAGIVTVLVLPFASPQLAVAGRDPVYTIAVVLGVPLWTVSSLLDSLFVAERAAGNMLARNVVFAALKIPLLLVPLLGLRLLAPLTILGSWVVASAVAALVGFVVLIPRLRRGYCPTVRGLVAQVRPMLSLFAGHHLINLGSMASVYLLQILVSARLSTADNAYFYTTWMLGGFFFTLETSVASSLFAEGAHGGDIGRKVRASALMIGALLIPAMILFLVAGRYLMGIFGPGYREHGAALLTLLVVAAIPDGITNVYVSILRVRRLLREAAALNLGMAALTIVLAWPLLPRLGIEGAGWAWLIAQTVGSCAVAIHMRIARPLGPQADVCASSVPEVVL